MTDVDAWTCPECGELLSGEAVVDPTFLARVEAHSYGHSADTFDAHADEARGRGDADAARAYRATANDFRRLRATRMRGAGAR